MLLATGLVFSQECDITLKGKVINLFDNAPLEAAVIQTLDGKYSSISSEDGSFLIENLCQGNLQLKISHLNCEDLFEEIDLTESSSKVFFIEHRIRSLDEVVVEDMKTRVSSTAKTYTLSESQKDRYGGEGLAKALEQISGVKSLSAGSGLSKPLIHGMFGSRVGIIYDGILLENQQWGQDHAPNVDVNAFEKLKLVKGASTLKYTGDTPGGIIVLESTPIRSVDSLFGKTIFNGVSNGKGIQIATSWTKTYNRGSYVKLQGMYKKSGDYSTPNYILTNTGSDEKNISFLLGRINHREKWKFYFSYYDNEVGILRSSHIGNVNDLLRAIESPTPSVIRSFSYDIAVPKQFNQHITSNAEYTKINDSNQSWSVKYNWQKNNRKEYDIRRGDDKYDAALDLNLNTHNLSSNFEWRNMKGAFDSGIFFQIQDNFSNPNTGVKRLIPDYVKFKTGSYFTANLRPKNFIMGFGIRYEHQNNEVKKYYRNSRWIGENYEERLGPYVTKEIAGQKLVKRRLFFNTFSANVGVKHNLSPTYDLGVNYNLSQRAPDIAEMFSDGLHHALASIEYGNPFLKHETTQKFFIDFEKKRGSFQFNISPYLTLGENYIIIEPKGIEQTIRGAFPVWEYNPISATLKGVDLDISYAFNKNIQLMHTTSWIEGINRSDKTPLLNMPPLDVKNQIRFMIPRWDSFVIKLHNQHVFRQTHFPNNNFDTTIIENGQFVTKNVDISTPPNGYNILGVEFNWGSYSFFSGKIDVTLAFDNLFNTSYRNYLNRMRFYTDEHGRNVMLQIKLHH